MNRLTQSGSALVAALVVASVPAAAQATQSAVVTWSEAALREVRAAKYGPPVVARALAIAHTCMYDAWAAYDTLAVPVASTVPRRPLVEVTTHNKTKAISHAAYQCLSNLFPAGQTRLADTLRGLGFDPNDTQTTNLTYGAGVGNAAAAAVLASRRNDGSNQYGDLALGAYADYTGYAPRNAPMPFCLASDVNPCPLSIADPWHWQPLVGPTGAVQKFIAPHWERVRPFALSSASQFDTLPEVAAGPRYLQSAQLYQADVDQVVQVSGALTPWQKLLVEYWADGPESELPPGHWGLYAQHVARRDFNSVTSLERDVKMFFAMHNASFDAGIVAWHLKRKSDGVRPITAVRANKNGRSIYAWGGPGQPSRWIDGSRWTPYNPGSNLTPAFPGWVSGHATFSAASAAVLRNFTGNDAFNYSTVIPANFGRVEPGVPAVPTQITYATFTQAANDAAASRLLGGIHFNDDNTIGLLVGDRAGQQAWQMSQFLFEGGLSAGTGSTATSPFTQSIDWQHTVPASNNRLLLVGVASDDGNGARSVSYGGLALTRLGWQTDSSGDNRIEIWYMVAPRVGTTNVNVQMNWANDLVAGAANYRGVDQSRPFGTLRGAGASSGTSACVTLANEPAQLVASFVAANGDAGALYPASGFASQFSGHSDWMKRQATDIFASGASGPSTPVGTVCQYLQISRQWAALAVPLRPAFSR
ncbi:vanadium-dependent haloperoxidase [Ideonella sp. A 288]|uniref:vanadium-dependent haloperoxidase n=1 Tax=Ideonella sp. A 288 TaxID=1962181 RepID=UPI001302F308|nr:vanadium-dependent haloperoxidase [Ideonella sp. A 288]